MPDLVVSIVNYHTERHVAVCLESLQRELKTCPMDVWVVDNGSDSESMDKLRQRFSWVKWSGSGWNIGFSKANNLVIRSTDSGYILLLNPDIEVWPGAIRDMLTAADARRDVGILSCTLVRPDESVQQGVSDHIFREQDDEPDQDGIVERPWVYGACMLVRREAIEKAGAMDEGFFLFHEDTEWCRRMWESGFKVGFLAAARMTHVEKSSYGSLDPEKVQLQRVLSDVVLTLGSMSRPDGFRWAFKRFMKALWCSTWYRISGAIRPSERKARKLESHSINLIVFSQVCFRGRGAARRNLMK